MSEWMGGAAVVLVAAGLGAGAAHVYTCRSARSSRVASRFRDATEALPLPARGRRLVRARVFELVRERMWHAGIPPAPRHFVMFSSLLSLVVGLGLLRSGIAGGAGMGVLLISGAWSALSMRCAMRKRQALEQLPGFLEHVARAVQTGSSVHTAIMAATADAEDPLRGVFERVNRQVECGAHLEDALDETHVLMDVRELRVFALTVRVNQRFGGSIRELLRSVVQTIRTRERVRREFRALTGETRLSAWVFGLLPALIVLYVLGINPAYLNGMNGDPVGRLLLMAGAGLQVVGSLILWRMVRSV